MRVPVRPPKILTPIIGSERVARIAAAGLEIVEILGGRRIVHVNSTAEGGGVAEMLPGLLGYAGQAAQDSRWFVLEGHLEFFTVTKRLHHRLHGEIGDGGPLGESEHAVMQQMLEVNRFEARAMFRQSDVVVLHDPQPAPFAKWLADRGQPVVWRCHIGVSQVNDYSTQAWNFLRTVLEPHVDWYIFSREDYVPTWVPKTRLSIIKPSLDPYSAKNRYLSADYSTATLQQIGILSGKPFQDRASTRNGYSRTRVAGSASITRQGVAPAPTTPLVLQVSRWDPLKDMPGVLNAFANETGCESAHLVLAGPDVTSVADDPEGLDVFNAVVEQWRELGETKRARISIVCLPMNDTQANAIMVNALQRHAAVVVQKSLKEGFGLTVTEAMFKRRPVVASAVGGIVDQIQDGTNGVLVNADDPQETGRSIAKLLAEPRLRRQLGNAAVQTVVAKFMPDFSVLQLAKAIEGLSARRN